MTELSSGAAATPPIDLARCTPGEYLRRLREEKGHTHAAVGSALHLTVHYIKALEGDEYGKLPGLTFVKGYLRSYARFLGADVDNVLARFDEHITGLLDAGMHTARVERSRRRQDQALRWGIGAGLVVVAGLAAGWWFMRDTTAPAPATALRAEPAQETPAAAGTAPAPSAAASLQPSPDATARAQANTAYMMPVPQQAALAPSGQGPLPTAVAALQAGGAGLVNSLTGMNGTATNLAGDADATLAPHAASAGLAESPALAGFEASAANPDAATTTAAPLVGSNAAAAVAGPRQIALIGAGNDELKLNFRGNSWIEVDDGNRVRLYNDMLSAGDTLTIRGVAPFRVLLGDAAHVDVSLNAMPVDFSAEIRTDSTARLVLGAPAAGQAQATPAPGAASPAAPSPADEVTQ